MILFTWCLLAVLLIGALYWWSKALEALERALKLCDDIFEERDHWKLRAEHLAEALRGNIDYLIPFIEQELKAAKEGTNDGEKN